MASILLRNPNSRLRLLSFSPRPEILNHSSLTGNDAVPNLSPWSRSMATLTLSMAGGSLFKQVSPRLLTTATMRTIINNDQIRRSGSSDLGGRSGLLGLVRLPTVVGVRDISTFSSSAGRSGIWGATSKSWKRYMRDSSIDLKNCRTFASKAFPKHFRGEMKGICCRGDSISFGTYALKALELAWVTSRQIEAGRRAIARCAHRGGKIWVRVIADKAVSAKPTEVRMGRGKGNPSYRAAVVKPGRILYEIAGVSDFVAKEAIALAASKLPIRTKFVKTV